MHEDVEKKKSGLPRYIMQFLFSSDTHQFLNTTNIISHCVILFFLIKLMELNDTNLLIWKFSKTLAKNPTSLFQVKPWFANYIFTCFSQLFKNYFQISKKCTIFSHCKRKLRFWLFFFFKYFENWKYFFSEKFQLEQDYILIVQLIFFSLKTKRYLNTITIKVALCSFQIVGKYTCITILSNVNLIKNFRNL